MADMGRDSQDKTFPCGLSAAGKAHSEHHWDSHGENHPANTRYRCEGIKLARVVLFKRSGKYYTEEDWRIPSGAIGPWDMEKSPDFRRIDGGAVLVESQEPWGYPILFPGAPNTSEDDSRWAMT